jgi:hypothetical protein
MRVRLVTVIEMPSWVNITWLEETEHWAVDMVAPFRRAWQAVTAAMLKAEVKLMERSKVLPKEVMALRTIWY